MNGYMRSHREGIHKGLQIESLEKQVRELEKKLKDYDELVDLKEADDVAHDETQRLFTENLGKLDEAVQGNINWRNKHDSLIE